MTLSIYIPITFPLQSTHRITKRTSTYFNRGVCCPPSCTQNQCQSSSQPGCIFCKIFSSLTRHVEDHKPGPDSKNPRQDMARHEAQTIFSAPCFEGPFQHFQIEAFVITPGCQDQTSPNLCASTVSWTSAKNTVYRVFCEVS